MCEARVQIWEYHESNRRWQVVGTLDTSEVNDIAWAPNVGRYASHSYALF